MNSKSVFSWKILAPLGLALVGITVIATSCAGTTGVTGGGGGVAVPPNPNTGGVVMNSISVTGTGEADGTPDTANVQLGIDVSQGDLTTAIQKANDTMTAVQAAVKGKGVDDKDLQTVNFNVYPEDVTDKTTGQPTGQRVYHVQNFLNVKIRDISKVGGVIDAGLSAGATNVNSLSFSVDDTTKLEGDARAKALKDAQNRAQQLADGVGVKLGKPILVSETLSGGPIYPQVMFAASAPAGKGGGAPPISTGQQTVTITVNVTYAIGQ